jgi:SAM-dependent methyltransferase
MGLYGDQLLPRLCNVLLAGEGFSRIRRRVASGLSGTVLEVGFGSGLNVPFYPSELETVLAVDPATLGRSLAAERVRKSPVHVEYVGLDGETLPLASQSVDHVLVTWTLCTIPDVHKALREMHRVLRPEGQLHFAEHGRSPDPRIASWQDRLTPLQRRWAGGCHLNRPVDQLIEGAGFVISSLETFFISGPRPFGHMYEGAATKH